MTVDAMLLQRALELPASAIGYFLGRELAACAHPRAVIELHGSEIDVWQFAKKGRCDVSLREGIHNQRGWTWKRRGELEEYQGTSWFDVKWEGHSIEVVMACWDRSYQREICHWIIADDSEVARRFSTALADFGALPDDANLVFSNGCWSHDTAGFAAIRAARSEDLILPDGVLEKILADARHFLNSRETYKKYGLAYKRGLLFAGAPGNGKTACIRVLLGELGLRALVVRSFNSRYGEVEQNVAAAFNKAKRAAPCALVLEDLDVLVRGNALSALLNELDGVGADTGILTLATSNHPEKLDPALADRPSRFDRVYRFEPPTPELRRRFLAHWNQRLENALRVNDAAIDRLVEQTGEFSFAFLQELVVSAMVRWVADHAHADMASILENELRSLREQRRAPTPESPQRKEEGDS